MAENKRDSFVFYRSFYEAIKELPRDVQGEVLTAVMEYSLNGETTESLKPVAKAIFTLIKPQIDANNKRFLNGKKGAEHGVKGGRPRKDDNPKETPKKPLKNPKETPNVNVNDNVIDIDKSILSEIQISDVPQDLHDEFKIASSFQKLFIKNLKEKKASTAIQEKATFKSYVDPIRLMLKNKESTIDELRDVYDYLDSSAGEFWKSNILSTDKLRKQITKLVMEARKNTKPPEEKRLAI